MADLHRPRVPRGPAGHEEPRVDEAVEHPVEARAPGVVVGAELAQGAAPARVGLAADARVDEADHQPPGGRAVVVVGEGREHLLGVGVEGALHRAEGGVGRARQRGAVAGGPEEVERVRHERERAGGGLHVAHDHVGEVGLEREPGGAGGALDGLAELLGRHLRDEHLVGGRPVEEHVFHQTSGDASLLPAEPKEG